MQTPNPQTWALFEFLTPRGQGVIEEWIKGQRLQVKAIARLNQKLDLLRASGPDLPPSLLAGPIDTHIYKLRVKAPRMQLRPLLCRGPLNMRAEFTLLFGAIERNNKLIPKNAIDKAIENRQILIQDNTRRRPHVDHF